MTAGLGQGGRTQIDGRLHLPGHGRVAITEGPAITDVANVIWKSQAVITGY
jgi:hypothetical protein